MEPKGQNEVDKFFEGLPSEEKKEVDIFEGDKPTPEKEKESDDKTPEKGHERRDNRQTRRLKEQLQQEREARLIAEARAEERRDIETKNLANSGEVPDAWIRMYGDTPEARAAWNLNKGILEGYAENAKKAAIDSIKAEQAAEVKATKEFEAFIDSELESIEDEFDVDVTSDSPAARKARRELLELVENLSPKDSDGSISGYADFHETFKIYQQNKKEAKPDASEKKGFASRSMERGGSDAPKAKEPTPGFFGWQKDLQ